MAEFSVKLNALKSSADEIKGVESKFNSLRMQVETNARGISSSIKNYLNIGSRLNNAITKGETWKKGLEASSSLLYQIDSVYSNCERKIMDNGLIDGKVGAHIGIVDPIISSGIADIVKGIDWTIKIGDIADIARPISGVGNVIGSIAQLVNTPLGQLTKEIKTKLSTYISQQDKSWLDKLLEVNQKGVVQGSYLHSILQFKDDKSGDKYSLLGEEGKYSFGLAAGSATLATFLAKIENEGHTTYILKNSDEFKYSAKGGYAFGDTNKKVGEKLGKAGLSEKIDSEDNGYYKDGKKISEKDAPDFYTKQATIFEKGVERTKSASLYEDQWSNEYGKVTATVGKAEAHASIKGGVYVVGKDGKKIFSPGVEAEVGASVTCLEVSAEGQVGNKMLGLNGSTTVTAGKVSGKASANVQVYDENGNFKPQLYGEAKVEAIAGEVSGKIGVNVLGGQVGVKAGVNVGVGAHASVGYKDGVFKVDVGASLGLGVSIKADIDVGGMVDTVVGTAKSVIDGAKNVLGKLKFW